VLHLKSEREINRMREAGLIVWQAHRVVERKISPGVTTGELNTVLARFFERAGAEPLFLNYPHNEQGKPPFPAVACISVNDEVVHGIPGRRVLKEGDIVSIDIGARLGGWCGDAAYTHAVGRISPQVQKLLDVTQGALELAFEYMHYKNMWSEIAREMAQYVRDHHFSVVECFVGHGIGRQMHEDPQVPNFYSKSLRGSGDFRIEPGLVIAVEPMVNIGTKRVKLQRDHWTQRTQDGKASAHFEHTIAVRNDGPFLLTQAPTPEESASLAALAS
jgi:methionyl aminopeptidase